MDRSAIRGLPLLRRQFTHGEGANLKILGMPRVSRKKVLEIIAHYWPDADPDEITIILDGYGLASSEQGRDRVQLAILKLCEGQMERLPELVRMAKTDYRDVLAYAEYPEEMKLGFIEMRKLSPEEARAVRQRDRDQYLSWLGS